LLLKAGTDTEPSKSNGAWIEAVDLGPGIAHAILPIPGKRNSDLPMGGLPLWDRSSVASSQHLSTLSLLARSTGASLNLSIN
jgi:hypothetical protein